MPDELRYNIQGEQFVSEDEQVHLGMLASEHLRDHCSMH